MAVPVKLSPSFEPGIPQPLFDIDASVNQLQPTQDGQHFLINLPDGGEAPAPRLNVVLYWPSSLQK